MIRRSSSKETRSPVGRYHLLISFFYVPLFCRWLFMDVQLGCDNPRVDVNLSIHCETARCSFGGAEETHMFCNPHIGFVKYHRIAMVNARLTIFSSCTIAISASFRIFAASSQLMITVLAFVIPMAFAGWDVEFQGTDCCSGIWNIRWWKFSPHGYGSHSIWAVFCSFPTITT